MYWNCSKRPGYRSCSNSPPSGANDGSERYGQGETGGSVFWLWHAIVNRMTRRKSNDGTPHQRTATSASTPHAWFEHRPWLLALVLVIVTFVAYQPTWHAGFIWDDDNLVIQNPLIRTS